MLYDFLVFFAYLALCLLALMKIPFFRREGVPVWIVPALFGLKVIAGIGYGVFFAGLPDFPNSSDTWKIHLMGIEEKAWLLRDPGAFIRDLFQPRYANDAGVLGTEGSMLNDLKSVVVIKFSAICSLLTGNRYYANLLFFEFLTLFGQWAIVLLWKDVFAKSPVWLVALVTLLVPSTLFWTSGFHKDGILLHSIGWIIWLWVQAKRAGHFTTPVLFGLVMHIGLLFLLRSQLAAFVVAASILANITYWQPGRAFWIVPAAIVVGILLVLIIDHYSAGINIPRAIAQRQTAFLEMKGDSKLPMPKMEEGWPGVIRYLPTAMGYGLLQPLPWLAGKVSYLALSLTNLLWLILFVPACLFWKEQWRNREMAAFMLFGLAVALLNALLIGYTIPFAAAIDRYKSIGWPLVFPPVGLLCWHWVQTRWQTLKSKDRNLIR